MERAINVLFWRCVVPFMVGVMLGGPIRTLAQETPTPTATATPIPGAVVRAGSLEYDIPADESLIACVDERSDTIDGARLSLRILVHPDDGWLALPAFEREATGVLAKARPGDCFQLAPEAVN